MGYTYCTKLAVNNSTSIDPSRGFPFAGYVNFTDYDAENPFEASDDYLQRWDVGSGMTNPANNDKVMCSEEDNTCVKINDMYCSTANEFQYRNQESFRENTNKVFLSMVPLSKNINSNDRGLTFFMDMESEIKTQKTIDFKYSTSSTINLCNLDFCAAGFCKSNIPYIGLEYVSRMIDSSLDKDDTNYYTLYSSNGKSRENVFGNSEYSSLISSHNSDASVNTYEFPGAGKLFLSPLSVYNNNSTSETLGEVTSTTYCESINDTSELYNCLAYKLCVKIMKVIGSILELSTNFSFTITSYNSITNSYTIGFDENISYDSKLYNKVNSYLNLLSQSGEVYYKINNENFEKPIQGSFGLNIKCIQTQDDPEYEGPDIPIYEWGEFRIGDSSYCSLYGNPLSYYYLEKGEKFNINDSSIGVSSINNGTYFFVIRSVANILLPVTTDYTDTSLYTCDATKSYLNKCNSTIPAGSLYNRMDLYPNASGKMRFLDSYLDSSDSSYKNQLIFKPRTSNLKFNTNHLLFRNHIPAFNAAPDLDDSNKLSRMGVIEEDVKIKFNGNLYVSEVTLVFEGETIKDLASTIIISGVRKNVKTDGLTNSYGNTEFVFQFTTNNSPAKIVSSRGNPSSVNMNVYTVGTHQMLKYCSFPGYPKNTSNSGEIVVIENEYVAFDDIYRLDNNSTYNSAGDSRINPEDSQMTFAKIIGRIPVYITGSGTYKSKDIKLKLISAYVKLTDDSSLDVKVNTLGINATNGYSTIDSPLYCMTATDSSLFKFVSPAHVELPYTIYRPFLGSMSGDIPRYTGNNNDSSLYNMGVSSFTSSAYSYKSGLDSLKNVICVGPNYSDSYANGGTLQTFLNSNSAYKDDLTFNWLMYDLGLKLANGDTPDGITGTRGTSVGTDSSIYYSISGNPFAAGSSSSSIVDELNPNSYDDKSYIELSLPEPHLDVTLVYDSVEFNRASAWTFMRSMPLNPGSKTAPHILIYKVEAWITGSDTNDVDSSATDSMHFDHNSSYIYSGYSDSSNEKDSKDPDHHFCVKGINEAIADSSILNNCYLKVDDGGNTEELNAVGTAFPIRDITGSEDFYGAPSLNAKIYSSNDASIGNSLDTNNDGEIDDNEIYNKLFSLAKTRLKEESDPSNDNGAQAVVFPYCYSGLKPSSTGSGDDRKVIYICVGFYNNREEMIPINGKFGITYDVKVGDAKTSYTKYMYLSQFFPKDSMIYLAGTNYKSNTEAEENNKLSFVTTGMNTKYAQLKGDGLYSTYIPETDEIVNIGPGSGITDASISYEIASSSKSVGHWGNVSDDSVSEEYAGHYGILNRYSGKVSFVSNVPYKNYKEYTDLLEGKCLLKQEHICYFPNKTGVVTLL